MTTRRAYWTIALVSAISILGIAQLPSLRFNYDFDNFFEQDDPEWVYYQEYVSQYGNDNDYLLIGIKNPSGIFKPEFLRTVDSLSRSLARIEGVYNVISPLTVQKIVNTPLGTVLLPYLHIEDEAKLSNDSTQIKTHPNLANRLLNDSISSVCLIIYHERYNNKAKEEALSNTIEDVVSEFGFASYHLAGRIKAQSVFVQLIRENFLQFLGLSMTLIIMVLYLMFRRLKWVVIPLLIVILSVALSLAALILTGESIDVLSSMLPTILLVTAMSDITHFLTRYFELIARGQSKVEAIRLSFREIGTATFLTSFTTAVGFATLLITDSLPVRNLGVFTALGVMITYVITFSLLPSVAIISKEPGSVQGYKMWNAVLGKIFLVNLRQGKAVMVVYGALLAVCLWGISRLEIDTPIIADFPEDHKVTNDFIFFDRYFGGSKPMEINLVAMTPNKTLFSPDILLIIDSLELFVRSEFNTDNLASPVGVAKTLNMANHGGQPEFYHLPAADDIKKIERQAIQNKRHLPIKILNDDLKSGRITGFSADVGSAIGLQQLQNLNEYLSKHIESNELEVKLTGTSYLFDLTTQSLVENILYGLAVAISVVAIIMALLFRSARMIVLALIPNVLPILFLAGLMGIFDIPLRLSTSIIFAIVFGIAVDDTIHFLSRYKIELDKNSNHVQALMHTYLSTGKAMIITTLILSAGFFIFIFSSFQATFYTGLLISITLLLALAIDLTLLPVLLLLFAKKNV